MAPPPRPEGALSAAAAAFEQELTQYEKVCAELRRTTVRSEKTLSRTRRLLVESTECEQALETRLQALLQAMNGTRDRQQACMEATLLAARQVSERATQFGELMARVAALGERTQEVSQPAAEVIAQAGGGAASALPPLNQVAERMALVLSEADAIASSADEADWPEVAREVKNLRQQLHAAHAKVLEARGKLEKRVLS
jgi:chromosome segregation ATPase